MVATQRRGLGGCDPVLWHDRIVQQASGPEVNVCEKGDSRHRARTLAGGQSKTQHLRPGQVSWWFSRAAASRSAAPFTSQLLAKLLLYTLRYIDLEQRLVVDIPLVGQ